MWRNSVTERSWNLLQSLRAEFSFTLIGGWAVYLYTSALKSKDVDIVNYESLEKLKVKYGIKKNLRLRKYEFTVEGIDVDTYVPFFSDLGIPVEAMLRSTTSIEGFTVPKAEYLLLTKQKAELERSGSEKGLKDRADIISLLLYSNVNLVKYNELLGECNLKHYLAALETLVRGSEREMMNLGIDNARKRRLLREKLIRKIRAAKSGRSMDSREYGTGTICKARTLRFP